MCDCRLCLQYVKIHMTIYARTTQSREKFGLVNVMGYRGCTYNEIPIKVRVCDLLYGTSATDLTLHENVNQDVPNTQASH